MKTVARREGQGQATSGRCPAKGFAGIEDNYFLEVLLPTRAATARALHLLAAATRRASPRPRSRRASPARATLEARAYFGPKDVTILESYGLGLERTVDFGWYGILARPLLWLLKKTLRRTSATGASRSSS